MPAELRPDGAALGPAGESMVVSSSAHVSIASSDFEDQVLSGLAPAAHVKKDCQAVRREMAPAGAKGLNGWLRVSTYQIASVSLRASSI